MRPACSSNAFRNLRDVGLENDTLALERILAFELIRHRQPFGALRHPGAGAQPRNAGSARGRACRFRLGALAKALVQVSR